MAKNLSEALYKFQFLFYLCGHNLFPDNHQFGILAKSMHTINKCLHQWPCLICMQCFIVYYFYLNVIVKWHENMRTEYFANAYFLIFNAALILHANIKIKNSQFLKLFVIGKQHILNKQMSSLIEEYDTMVMIACKIAVGIVATNILIAGFSCASFTFTFTYTDKIPFFLIILFIAFIILLPMITLFPCIGMGFLCCITHCITEIVSIAIVDASVTRHVMPVKDKMEKYLEICELIMLIDKIFSELLLAMWLIYSAFTLYIYRYFQTTIDVSICYLFCYIDSIFSIYFMLRLFNFSIKLNKKVLLPESGFSKQIKT